MRLLEYKQHRGMNRLANQLNMTPDWLYDIQNGYIDKDNNIQMRNGITKYNTVAMYGTPTISYITEVKWNSGTKDIICYATDRYWWIYRGTALTGTASATTASHLVDTVKNQFTVRDVGRLVTNTTDSTTAYITAYNSTSDVTLSADIFVSTEEYRIEIGFGRLTTSVGGASARGQAVMFNDTLYFADAAGGRKCSSSYVIGTAAGAPTDATAVWVHNEHVIWNSLAAPSNVYVSAYRNGEDYTTANDALTLTLNYVTPVADTVIGFATYGEDVLVILGKQYILAYNAPQDTQDWSKQDMIESGALSAHASCTYGQNLFIPGRQGVNTYIAVSQSKEDVSLDDVTYQTAPLYQSYITSLTSDYWFEVSAVVDRLLDLMYISFPIGYPTAGSHEILVYSFLQNQVVGRYTGINAYSFARLETGVILIGGASGFVYTMNSGTTDSGTTIPFSITTPFYDAGSESYKVCRYADVVVEHTATFTLSYKYQWEEYSQTTISESIVDNARDRNRFKTGNVLGRGKKIQLVIEHSTTSGVIINIPEWSLGFIDEGLIK